MYDCTRQLVHVPILHSPADMGSISGELESAYIEAFGRRRWHEHVSLIDHFWQAAATAVDGLGLDYGRVDLYQDGLPVCGRELDIAREVAGESENYRLLLALVGRGARLVGTEDPELLLEEYRAIQANRTAGAAPGGAAVADRARRLLQRRDAFIAGRIDQTLQPGRTGLLFLGLLHDIRKHLPADIVVRRLEVLNPVLFPKSGMVQTGGEGEQSPRFEPGPKRSP